MSEESNDLGLLIGQLKKARHPLDPSSLQMLSQLAGKFKQLLDQIQSVGNRCYHVRGGMYAEYYLALHEVEGQLPEIVPTPRLDRKAATNIVDLQKLANSVVEFDRNVSTLSLSISLSLSHTHTQIKCSN